jgi:hypothetical protein
MKLSQATSPEYAKKFEPVEMTHPVSAPLVPIQPTALQPGPGTFLRCPMPQITSSVDSLRQFYNGGVLPQTRLIPGKSLTNQ